MRTKLGSNYCALSMAMLLVSTKRASTSFEDGPDFVQSLARGLQVMKVFDRQHAELTQAEVAERSGLPRAVVRRSLLTLKHLGYVDVQGRAFHLTVRALDLGSSYLSSLGLSEVALPHMQRLAAKVRESTSLSILDQNDIVYIARVPVHQVVRIGLNVGARLPAFAASMGRALLADLPDEKLEVWLKQAPLRALTPHTLCERGALRTELLQIRKQGYALVMQELEPALCSVAVPVRQGNRAVAALNIGMQFRKDIKAHVLKTILPELLQTRGAIERELSHDCRSSLDV